MTTAQLEGLLAYAFSEEKKGKARALMRAFLGFLKMLKRIEPVQSDPDLIWECPWIRTQGKRMED